MTLDKNEVTFISIEYYNYENRFLGSATPLSTFCLSLKGLTFFIAVLNLLFFLNVNPSEVSISNDLLEDNLFKTIGLLLKIFFVNCGLFLRYFVNNFSETVSFLLVIPLKTKKR